MDHNQNSPQCVRAQGHEALLALRIGILDCYTARVAQSLLRVRKVNAVLATICPRLDGVEFDAFTGSLCI
jgi:hypothetical protein